MKTEANSLDLHVFVCTNEKAGQQGCAPVGGAEIANKLKSWSRSAGLKGRIRINKSGCLGKCDDGVVCVAYPAGEWVLGARESDLPALQEWIKGLNQA